MTLLILKLLLILVVIRICYSAILNPIIYLYYIVSDLLTKQNYCILDIEPTSYVEEMNSYRLFIRRLRKRRSQIETFRSIIILILLSIILFGFSFIFVPFRLYDLFNELPIAYKIFTIIILILFGSTLRVSINTKSPIAQFIGNTLEEYILESNNHIEYCKTNIKESQFEIKNTTKDYWNYYQKTYDEKAMKSLGKLVYDDITKRNYKRYLNEQAVNTDLYNG